MQHSSLPVIDHDRFGIRSLLCSDLENWYAYLSLPHVYEHTSWSLSSIADLSPLFDAFESLDPESAIRFAIADRASNDLVGTVGFHGISNLNKTAELAYDLNPQVWKRGLATLCARAAIEWAMMHLQFHRVQATVLPSNVASIKVIERCGMQLEGTLRKLRMVRGVPEDFLLYSIIT